MSVGAPLPHDAAHLHVTGAARYADDAPMPAGTLHLAFGLSTIAKGRIKSMDLAPVLAAEGVVRVIVARDLPHANDVSPSAHDEPLLSDGTVHYVGQPIYCVVATSHLAARKAARLAIVDYAAETPILTIDEALDAESRFEDGPVVWTKGDPDAAMATAAHRLSGQIEIGGQEHFYLEGQAALALPQEGGDMVVQSSTQHPTEIQHKVAEAIGSPMHAVRVETRRMGGGFGGKESQGNALAVACAVAAKLTGKPCKMRYDRDDDMVITGKRHDFRIAYDVGFDASGRIEGLAFTQFARCGWAQDLSLPVADRAMLHADNAYLLPAVRITSHRLKTNTQSATAFRGFGGPQGMVGIERVMEDISHQLGVDPLEVRRFNYYEPMGTEPSRGKRYSGAHSPEGPEVENTTPYSMPVTDFVLDEMTDVLVTTSDYKARRGAIAVWNAANPIMKKGIALVPVKFGISFTLTHLNQAGALVHVYQDGSIHLNHGGTEMGQGLFRKVAQVAASQFGVDIGAIKITATDTGKVPNTSATAASSGSDLNGMAVLAASESIKERMAKCLAEAHGGLAKDVAFEGGMVRIREAEMPFAEAAMFAYTNRVSLSATGFYKTPDLSWDRAKGTGCPFFYFAQGAAVTEVVIDTLTGENRMLRCDILHDAGASLNPALDIGQIEGGFIQGAGWLTTEELVWDGSGELKTHAPSTYKIPACSDRPPDLRVALWDEPNPAQTIYRSKAVGEPPFMLGMATFFALNDALRACGPNDPRLDAPATAEQVLAAVERARE